MRSWQPSPPVEVRSSSLGGRASSTRWYRLTSWRTDGSDRRGWWPLAWEPAIEHPQIIFSVNVEALELPLKWTRHAKASTGLRYFRLYLIVIYFQRESKLRLQLWVSYSSGMCCSPGLENVTSWDVSHPHATTRVQRQQCVPEPYPSKGQGQCSTQSPQNLLREREVKLPLELPCSSHTDWNLTNSSKCLENYVK